MYLRVDNFCVCPENEGIDRLNDEYKILDVLVKEGLEDLQKQGDKIFFLYVQK